MEGASSSGGGGGKGRRASLITAGKQILDDNASVDNLPGVVQMAQNRSKGATAREVFMRIDRDGGGELDRRETRRALKELGIDPDSKLVQRQVKKFDEDGDGHLDLEEFEAFVSSILDANNDPATASVLAAFENIPHLTGVSTGDRMGLVRSAKVHSFGANPR